MPTDDELEQAYQALEAEGVAPTYRKLQARSGLSKYRVGQFLRQRRARTPPVAALAPEVPPAPRPEPPEGLTLALVRAGARTCTLMHLQPHPFTTLDAINQDRWPHFTALELWQALVPVAATPQEQQALRWKLQTLGGTLLWSQGEAKTLDQLWQREVVEKVGRIGQQEQATWERQQFAQLAQKQREAAARAQR